jgi:mono/diheme cytochrome c family protein
MRCLAFALLSACTEPHSAPPERSDVPMAELRTQVEQGKQLFAASCAECHGDTGGGTDDGPALIGANTLLEAPHDKRDVAFDSAADVLAWILRAMPADNPGTIDSARASAILAFVLDANGVRLERPIDVMYATSIVLH